ncbi:MAG: sugar phosphate nucleotidyltransferase [bacterium]
MLAPPSAENRWSLLLAAGDGTRLAHLTRGEDGICVPKQFCSVTDGPSLLELTRDRARRVVPESRIMTVVSAWHARWWTPLLGPGSGNVVVQPQNRGTAVGLLVPLLSILERDPEARVWVLPTDHWVGDEETLARAVRKAFGRIEEEPDRVVILGISPDAPDTQYGWILPETADRDGFKRVASFVEKPAPSEAKQLLDDGGVWNSFLLVARAHALVSLYERRLPTLLATMRQAVAGRDLAEVYATLPALDFSKDVLEGSEDHLSLLPVPSCGWSDLGTPERLVQCLATLGARRRRLERVRMPSADARLLLLPNV